MAHHFILLRLNPFGLGVDREEWWFEHSMSWLLKNVSWPWLSPLPGWGSLTMAFTGKFVYMYIYILTIAFCINVKFILIIQGDIFIKPVIFRILRIFNGLPESGLYS